MPPPLRVLTRGSILVGKHGQRYVLLDPLVQRKGKQCNVWSAIKQDNPIHQFVLKKPDDEDGPGWPDFTQEMEMQKLLYKSGYIRRMVDIIPPSPVIGIEPPIMVLEAFEKSLWTARLRRPFSLGEIRSIMRSIAIGLSTIHHNNMVCTGLSPRTGLNINGR